MEKYISQYKGAEIDAAIGLANSALQPGSLSDYALNSQVTQLQQSINQKADKTQITQLQQNIDNKADSSVVTQLQQTVDQKADKSQITTLQQNVDKKADQSQITQLQQSIDQKADSSQISQLQQSIDQKADQSQIEQLQQNIDQKADNSQVSQLQQTVDQKADLSYVNDNFIKTQIYGVTHKYENASPILTRIGNMDLHRTLPIQSLMRRCLLTDDGTVTYLDANDSTKTIFGGDAVLDGSAGQVMVEIPEHYRKFTLDTNNKTYSCEMSLYPFTGAHLVNKCYISAYEAALDRTNNKLSSVVNTTEQFRGGNNTSGWDNTYRSLLGKPATNISLTSFRTYANNRGSNWKCQEWDIYCSVFWLYTVEYANLNCQDSFIPDVTTDGFHKGGLGSGVTSMSSWDTYNNYNPIVPCGATNSLGNNTGIVTHAVLGDSDSIVYNAPVPSYRGIENPFGHVWKWTDGVLALGNGTIQTYYKCINRSKYSSTITSDYLVVGTSPTGNGYKKEIVKNQHGDILTSAVGGSSSTYFCDYHYQSVTNSTTYGVLSGGHAYDGSNTGFGCLGSTYAPGAARATIGSRLTYCNKQQIIN